MRQRRPSGLPEPEVQIPFILMVVPDLPLARQPRLAAAAVALQDLVGLGQQPHRKLAARLITTL